MTRSIPVSQWTGPERRAFNETLETLRSERDDAREDHRVVGELYQQMRADRDEAVALLRDAVESLEKLAAMGRYPANAQPIRNGRAFLSRHDGDKVRS